MRNEVNLRRKTGARTLWWLFKPSELGLPDTLRGRKVKEYAISKYQNTLIDGVPYSLPFMKPAVNISHDEAIRLCESKGEGWHLITNDEWVALGFWSWDNDTMPTGNTASGKKPQPPRTDRHYIRRRLRQDVDRIRPGSVESRRHGLRCS